ncbi:MAG: TolC family protein [Sphingobacteriia bacterium]|nr:TolC family protein [Sphingobacteriia bacterium]
MQKLKHPYRKILISLFLLIVSNRAISQTTDTLITLKDALQMAEQRYHLLKSKQYEISAAQKNVDVVKYNSTMPSLDASYQANIATSNNATGMFYPSGVLPISGPPSASNNYSPATGSIAALLLNWEAINFGQRSSKINVAVAEAGTKEAEYKENLFRHKINTLSTYLDVLLEYDYLKIYKSNIERTNVNLEQSRVLTNSGIKPGVDTALFLSEQSKAKIDWMNTQKQLQVYQLLLAQLIVTDALPVPSDTAFLKKLPATIFANDTSFKNNPAIQFAQSQYQLSKSKELFIKKSYLPKLNLWGTTFGRGSGFQPDGSIKTFDGLVINRFNYGAGVQLSFPIMKLGETKGQLQQQNFLSAAVQEKINDTKAALQTQQQIANATYANSVAIAKETQQQLKSAQYAFSAMQIRYNTGLVNFADLIQSQYNLLKAELDNKKAYWDVWKALLLQAAIQGDETIFTHAIQ